MKNSKLKLQRKTAFTFMGKLGAEMSKSEHPTTTTATTRPTITFLCKV
jgi:hypothetical protein